MAATATAGGAGAGAGGGAGGAGGAAATTTTTGASGASASASDTIDPLRLLQDDLKDDDYETVITAVSRITTVALALGPTRARGELLPYLLEFSETDNDEAQATMGRQLNGDFLEVIGGAAHGAALLPLLEKLAGEEEAVVREAAVESLSKVVGRVVRTDVATKFLPMLKRLANGDWFTTRVSACGVFAATYPHVSESQQAELRALFTTLCNDDTPMVRKAAFIHLGKYAAVLQKQYLKTDVFPILKTLSQDDLDSMRIYTIDCCAALGAKLDPVDFVASFLPIIEALQDDTSWRVRQQLARDMPRLCESSINEQISAKRLLPLFAKLLRDREPEVRATACQELARVAPFVRSGLLEFVAPCLEPLAIDPVVNVRVCFAQSLCQLCPAFGKETSAKLLVPLIQQLAKDDNFEVRNHIIGNIDTLAEALGPAGLTAGVLPALLELSKDPKWRVRMAVVDKTSLLAKHLGVKTFEKKLQGVLIVSLSDHVFAIREKACEQIGGLVRQFGGKWAAEKFFPQAFAIYDKNTNYLHRMTCLLVIHHVASACGAEVVERSLLPLVLTAAIDDVANVRIAGAKALGDLVPHLDRTLVAAKIKPVLLKLVKDPDPDVAYFSGQSLTLC